MADLTGDGVCGPARNGRQDTPSRREIRRGPSLYKTLVEVTGARALSIPQLVGLLLWGAERARTSPEDLEALRARGIDFLTGAEF